LAEMRHAVLITVIADVVRHYINIRGLEARLEFARNNVATAQKTLDIVQTRFDRGLRQLAVLQARPSDLTAAILDARSRMAILRGTYSEEIAPEWRRRRGIPRIPDYVRPGLPLDLLRRRPDIRQAEREVAAATARIGAATADLFPTVSVTTGFGAQGGPRLSNGATDATPPIRGPIWSIGPSGYWPVLDFGRLDALIIAQELKTHEPLVNYKKTILVAVAASHDARRPRSCIRPFGQAGGSGPHCAGERVVPGPRCAHRAACSRRTAADDLCRTLRCRGRRARELRR
jgi:outer membrane protein TolC